MQAAEQAIQFINFAETSVYHLQSDLQSYRNNLGKDILKLED